MPCVTVQRLGLSIKLDEIQVCFHESEEIGLLVVEGEALYVRNPAHTGCINRVSRQTETAANAAVFIVIQNRINPQIFCPAQYTESAQA